VAGRSPNNLVRVSLVAVTCLCILKVRFVKHNLNKPLQELRHELQLRPNNNDLSVMSIIQGRRITFSPVTWRSPPPPPCRRLI
jgi:hypothetical protein